ncbi:MAG: hypothetical protein A4S09_05665 [Proteobacteria bacterium SG_bin7]|nr:MAG: hypothetical protein A4S09_05665 [Proteobacteria bacterium SG_bin7]
MSFSFQDRANNIARFENEIFDLVIVGGGITGAGVARDACSRGMKVALVEAKDFASGTSSRSSKLIHGGLRYLENLEFHLVFEALSERRTLLEIAPHLVHPLKFFLPLYQNSRVGMFKLGLGMWLYDILSQFDAPEMHQRFDSKETIEEISILNPRGLVGSFSYYDAYMDDDRLVYETLRSAHNLGMAAANYCGADNPEFVKGKLVSIGVTDELSKKSFRVRGKHFISAVGPWTDIFGSKVLPDWKRTLRPTKGIHLTLSKERLPIRDVVVMSDDEKKRIVFVIPRFDMVIVGTTDTDYSGDPGEVSTDEYDVKYLLELLSEYFPGANLTTKDIISSYAGVRPLVDDGSVTEGKTSREHTIVHDPRNITFVAGGKYTTYRKMAEQIVDEVLENFAFEAKVNFKKSNTKVPLNSRITKDGFEDLKHRIKELARDFDRPELEMEFLIHRHGAEAFEMMAKYGRYLSVWELEAYHAIFETMCMNITDYMVRRVPLFLASPDHGNYQLQDVANVFASALKISSNDMAKQMEEFLKYQKTQLAWKGLS